MQSKSQTGCSCTMYSIPCLIFNKISDHKILETERDNGYYIVREQLVIILYGLGTQNYAEAKG